MGRHRPGEGMTPVTDLVDLPQRDKREIQWPTGATEDYADELREMRAAIAEDVLFDRTQDAVTKYQEEREA